MTCPYCSSDNIRIRTPVKTDIRDDKMTIVYGAVCCRCGSTFYAIRRIELEELPFECVRAEDLKDRTRGRAKRSLMHRSRRNTSNNA